MSVLIKLSQFERDIRDIEKRLRELLKLHPRRFAEAVLTVRNAVDVCRPSGHSMGRYFLLDSHRNSHLDKFVYTEEH